MNEYNVVVASDRNYIGFVSVLFASILATKKEDERIRFHVLANDIPIDFLNPLYAQMKNEELSIYPIENLKEKLGIQVPNTIAITSYARLFLAEILPSSIDRVLYLDCDIIINDSLGSLFSIDLTDYYVAGVLDTLPNNDSKLKVGLSDKDSYINAGMLLINLEKWRSDNVMTLFLDFLQKHNGCVHHHDQGIINGVLKKKYILNPEFNLTSNYFTHKYSYLKKTNNPFYSFETIARAKANPIIIHFTEGFLDRPWVKGSKHPFRNRFLEFKKMSIIADEPLQESKKTWYVKLLGFEFIHLPLFFYNTTSYFLSFFSKILKG